MPEYGRNVQHMVEHALTIENKEERNACVQAIMKTMQNLFPYLRNEESRHKMYDHLAIMSDFKLDIDSPYEQPSREELKYKPEKLEYNTRPIRFRHYGRTIEGIIQEAIKEQDETRKNALIRMILLRMRHNFQLWNKDTIDNAHLEQDLNILSKGQLKIQWDVMNLPQPQQYQPRFQNLQPNNNFRRRWK